MKSVVVYSAHLLEVLQELLERTRWSTDTRSTRKSSNIHNSIRVTSMVDSQALWEDYIQDTQEVIMVAIMGIIIIIMATRSIIPEAEVAVGVVVSTLIASK